MSYQFVLEINFDVSKQTQKELANWLHTIARELDIGIVYDVKKFSGEPVNVKNNDQQTVGTYTLK